MRWGTPRVVYWQHASDPITWWSPALLVQRPDWLREPLGPDSAHMWAAILDPAGWTDRDTARVHTALADEAP